MEGVEVHDGRFRSYVLGNCELDRLFGGMRWVEGLGATVFRQPSWYSNGNTRDRQGRLVTCEQDANHVFRLDPASGAVAPLADDFVQPNGIAFSPDESLLYVADTGGSHDPARRFPPGSRRQRLDQRRQGRQLLRAGWAPSGAHQRARGRGERGLRRAQRNRLFIAATTSVYSIFVAQTGLGYFGR